MATVEVVGEPRYVLTLTKEEARTLLFVTNQVGGPREGRRGHIESISDALSSARLKVPSSFNKKRGFELADYANSIYFV